MEYRDGLTYHSIILRYRDDLLTRAFGESQNNDETYMYRRNKSSISPKSLLASFIEEALHALGDLSCVPTILFEGYTMGGSMALLTDFAGQPGIMDF
ncbi:unnamed protein product [Rhizophagus irregularis]|nr:unnamed protein product [Rhizophagus irregularis]